MSSVLKIKDPNTGNWISILAIKGDPGADAYEKAVEQGYTGTSEQFYVSLAEVSTKANLTGGNIFTGNQTFDTNTFFIDTVNRRVGFGTTTPILLVDIVSTGDATIGNKSTSAFHYTGLNLYTYNGLNAASIQYGNASASAFTNEFVIASRQAAIPIKFYQGGTSAVNEKIRIDSLRNICLLNSNIAIGSTSATSLFQVTQPTTGSGTVTTNGTITLTGSGTQFTNTFKVGDTITVLGETVRTIASITSDTSLTVSVAFSTTASGLSYTLVGGDRFVVKGNGYIGVNNPNPQKPLDVIGDISSSGIIRASGGTAVMTSNGFYSSSNGTIVYGSTYSGATSKVEIRTNNNAALSIDNLANAYFAGKGGFGVANPLAVVHLKAGTATAATAPLKLSPGVLLTTPEQGAIEFVDDSTNGHFYITLNTNGVLSRKEIAFKDLATALLNGLMSSSDKTKLDGIENSANNYIHPATHSADIITDGSTNKVFTATEKTKLAGIESNANNYVHPATHSADIITDGTTNKAYTAEEKTKLSGIATGAQVNNISDVNATDLTDGGATTLHKHSYNNLDDKPTIPNAQIQSDWNQSNNTLKDFIKNKPTIPTVTNDFTNTYKNALDRLSGFNSVTTLTSLPITKQSILASVTAATTISLAATLADGLILHVKVYNTSGSAITQTLPTTGSFESKKNDGTNKTSISIPAGGNAEISIWAINNKYILKTDI